MAVDAASLGEFEQLVLLGVLHGGEDAYGVPVWREIEGRTGRTVSLAAVYKTLDRLEAKGLVRSRVGEPTAERGGRAKRVYRATPDGVRAVRAAVRAVTRMTDGLDEVLGT
jgi:PadR family transcriptional regulator, regulatory protein PadR